VLGNPKAWLGTAYHEVLAAAGGHRENNLDIVIAGTWNAAIDREYQRAKGHLLNRRFGKPESWPGYYLIAAMAKVRAQERAVVGQSISAQKLHKETSSEILREQKFSGACGKIVGRPDIVQDHEIIDFKSGHIHDEVNHQEIRPSYIRQLCLYAFIVKETLGWWAHRGLLLPMAGSPVEVELDPHECEWEAKKAVQILDEYNALLDKVAEPSSFASPSPSACQWCAFQIICPAFWQNVGPHWAGEFLSGAITGVVCEEPRAIQDEAVFTVSIAVQGGTDAIHDIIELSPLNDWVFPDVASPQKGDVVRAAGLKLRPDRAMGVTKRTIMANARDIPAIVITPDA
jgi:CRISPR/Cas system-associated exonuclease Cas4 (RecB family)